MDKEIQLYAYNRILVSNKKEQNIDILINMDGSQHGDAEWKKPDKKKNTYSLIAFIKPRRKCKWIYSDRNQNHIRGLLGMGGGEWKGGVDYKGAGGNFGEWLIVAMGSSVKK